MERNQFPVVQLDLHREWVSFCTCQSSTAHDPALKMLTRIHELNETPQLDIAVLHTLSMYW